MTSSRRGLCAAVLTLACALMPALAQDYPLRPVKVIVPSAAGGGYDTVGRLLADKLSEEFRQPFVVENRPGAGAVVGTQAALNAPADGHTLLVGGLANFGLTPGLYDKLPFDPAADFVPLGLVATFSYTLIARKDLPFSTPAQLMAFARDNPGKVSIATAGAGSGQHIAAALLEKLAQVDLNIIAYKGAQPAYNDLLGGRVDLFFDNTATAKPLLEADRIKAVLTSSNGRDPLLPSVPAAKELGLDLVLESWIGLFAPARTPAAVLDRLRASVAKVAQAQDLRKRFESAGFRPLSMSAAETDRFFKAEVARWPSLIRQAGIKAE